MSFCGCLWNSSLRMDPVIKWSYHPLTHFQEVLIEPKADPAPRKHGASLQFWGALSESQNSLQVHGAKGWTMYPGIAADFWRPAGRCPLNLRGSSRFPSRLSGQLLGSFEAVPTGFPMNSADHGGSFPRTPAGAPPSFRVSLTACSPAPRQLPEPRG